MEIPPPLFIKGDSDTSGEKQIMDSPSNSSQVCKKKYWVDKEHRKQGNKNSSQNGGCFN